MNKLSNAGWQALWALIFSAVAAAQAPAHVPISGSLSDADGNPLDGEEVELTLSLYDAESGGTAIYSESTTLTPEAGRFSHLLGTGESADGFDLALFAGGGPFYLGITVGEDDEAEPRIALGTVPFAAYANEAGNAELLSGKSIDELQPAVSGSCESYEAIQGFDDQGGVQCAVIATPSGGTLTGVSTSAGSGLTGGCASGTCPLAVDFAQAQRRLVGSCEGGEFMVSVGSDGALECVAGFDAADAVAAMGTRSDTNPLNHDRYTDAEAVAAMGAKSNSNALHHDRYTDAEARAVCYDSESELTTALNDEYVSGVTAGGGMTGGGTSGTVTVSHADTSDQLDVTNDGTSVIQSVALDEYGHVTSVTSTTLTTLDSLGACSTGDVPVWNGSSWGCGEPRARLFSVNPTLLSYASVTAPSPLQGSGHVTVHLEDPEGSADPVCNSSRVGMTRIMDTGPEQYYCFCNQVNFNGDYRWWCIEVEP